MRTNRHNTGIGFQGMIESTARTYQASGWMRLRKVDPPTRVVGSGAARRIIYLENPFLDFIGSWTERKGRMVVIECKSTSKEKLPFDSSGGVTVAQLDSLRHWHNAGAVAFVLWEFKGQVKMVTAEFLAKCRDENRREEHFKYIHWEDLGEPMKQGRGLNLVDFLPEMRARWT